MQSSNSILISSSLEQKGESNLHEHALAKSSKEDLMQELHRVQAETPLAWSPTGSHMLFASENHSIYLCEYNESKEDGTITVPITETLPTQHRYKVLDASFHPLFPATQEVVSCGLDGIIIWDTSNSQIKHRLELSKQVGDTKLHTGQVECLCWAYDGAM